MLARQIVIKMYNYHAFLSQDPYNILNKISSSFSIMLILSVYVIQRIMIVQAGPAFLQFP